MKKENQLQLFDVEPIEKPQVCAGGFPSALLEPMLKAAQKETGEANVFPNGANADLWMSHNCNRCAVPNGSNERVKKGLDCIGEYCVALGFITGIVPKDVVNHFGMDQFKCKQFK